MTAIAHDKNELLTQLTAVRDAARVRIHLLSMEARDRWAEFETRIDNLEHSLKDGSEKVGAAASRVVELQRAAGEFLSTIVKVPGLSGPLAAIMASDVRACRAGDSLARAAEIMWEEDLGALPVLGEDGRVVGMLTDRDICMAAYTQGKSLHDLCVTTAMSKTVHSCHVDDTIDEAAAQIARHRVRRLPVLSASGRLAGVVSVADIVRHASSLQGAPDIGNAVLRLYSSVSERARSTPDGAA